MLEESFLVPSAVTALCHKVSPLTELLLNVNHFTAFQQVHVVVDHTEFVPLSSLRDRRRGSIWTPMAFLSPVSQ